MLRETTKGGRVAENLLLAMLPKEERARLEPFLERLQFATHDVLIEPYKHIENVYFLGNCVTSTLQDMSDGSSIETGLMGVEGLVGIQIWMGTDTTPTRTIVQIEGGGFRMSTADFVREVVQRKESPLNRIVGLYINAFLSMTSLTAACNRLHTVDERLCRWLGMTHERIRRREFNLRQEFISRMLGVHRPTVSIAARTLQKAGLITYSRGQMKILDPAGLRDGACECLDLMEGQFDKIFGQPWKHFANQVNGGPPY